MGAAPRRSGSGSKGILTPRNAAERNGSTYGLAWLGPAWGEMTPVTLGAAPPVDVPNAAVFTLWDPAPFRGQEQTGGGAPSADNMAYMIGRSARPGPELPLARSVIVITGRGH